MFRETVQVHFHGFQPTDRSSSRLEEIAKELQLEAPQSSVIRMTFTMHEDKYHGTVHIHSSAGRFYADSIDDNLFVAGDLLLERVRRQLSKWKTRRLHEKQNLSKAWLEHDTNEATEAS